MSKDLATNIRAGFPAAETGVGMPVSIASMRTSMFASWWAHTGTIGEFSAIVPLVNALISL